MIQQSLWCAAVKFVDEMNRLNHIVWYMYHLFCLTFKISFYPQNIYSWALCYSENKYENEQQIGSFQESNVQTCSTDTGRHALYEGFFPARTVQRSAFLFIGNSCGEDRSRMCVFSIPYM
jgi:hypothetical protein